jgi:hypothetical protein
MSEIKKIGEILNFLEKKYDVNFQLKLLDENLKVTKIEEDTRVDYRGCYSVVHNTNKLACFYYNKKNF